MTPRERYELLLRTKYGKAECLACGAPLGPDLRHLPRPRSG